MAVENTSEHCKHEDCKILISDNTRKEILNYLNSQSQFGTKLQSKLKNKNISELLIDEIVKIFLSLKVRICCYESCKQNDKTEIYGVNYQERKILGKIATFAPVKFFDQATWGNSAIQSFKTPLEGYLSFIPAPLLQNYAELNDVIENNTGKFNEDKYYELMENRLLPVFKEFNDASKTKGKKAFITVPCMGCNFFAGSYKKIMRPIFARAVKRIFQENSKIFDNVSGVYIDNYSKHVAESNVLNEENSVISNSNIKFIINDASKRIGQIQNVSQYGNEFKDSILCNVAAWDHMSKEGNEGLSVDLTSRTSDDPAKQGASNFHQVFYELKNGDFGYDTDKGGTYFTKHGLNKIVNNVPNHKVVIHEIPRKITQDETCNIMDETGNNNQKPANKDNETESIKLTEPDKKCNDYSLILKNGQEIGKIKSFSGNKAPLDVLSDAVNSVIKSIHSGFQDTGITNQDVEHFIDSMRKQLAKHPNAGTQLGQEGKDAGFSAWKKDIQKDENLTDETMRKFTIISREIQNYTGIKALETRRGRKIPEEKAMLNGMRSYRFIQLLDPQKSLTSGDILLK